MAREHEKKLRVDVSQRLSRFDDPLIPAMIQWIDRDALLAACDAVGMVKRGTGVMITPHQMARVAMDALRQLEAQRQSEVPSAISE